MAPPLSPQSMLIGAVTLQPAGKDLNPGFSQRVCENLELKSQQFYPFYQTNKQQTLLGKKGSPSC